MANAGGTPGKDDDEGGPPPGAADAREAGLLYVDDTAPGIRRRRCGRGFRYDDATGRCIRDQATLARIRKLAIPPAYVDVWICASPRGHLQATGRDARGRKQYRYHPDWRSSRDANKFDRLLAFGHALPRLRRRLRSDLALPGMPREKALAALVTIMATTLMRIGNDEYARDNGSYGLTTLRNRHARFLRSGVRLQFNGKSGRAHDADIGDPRLVRIVRAMHELPGQRLFQYRDEDGSLRPLDSSDANEYLRERMGGPFTAKDFRTWGATSTAFRLLAATPVPEDASQRDINAVERQVVDAVAAMLGNTPAVCRRSYIDPRVFDGWQDGRLQRAARGARGPRQWEAATLRYLRRVQGGRAR
jgi:DNA topoisomerase I